jgi:thiol-disulfide isomerase/thioredoxin
MARTFSTMAALGSTAPGFRLSDAVTGEQLALQEIKGDIATVILFICNHCPFVKHVNAGLVKLANDYTGKGISFVAINSNDTAAFPEDSPEQMKKVAATLHYPFPYLFDETQQTARDYQAACTPDFFVYDKNLQLAYRGQLDDARPGNGLPVTGRDIRDALDCLLDDRPVPVEQRPAIGCSIKWKE